MPLPSPAGWQVYFVPSSRSLRKKKKYQVPHCPLLQVRGLAVGGKRLA